MPNQNGLIINWLLEDDNPAVKHRTLTELLGKSGIDSGVARIREQVLNNIPQAIDKTWMMSTRGMLVTYNLLALAECGLTKEDVDVSAVFKQWLQEPHSKRLYTSTWWPSSVNWKPKFQFDAPPSISSLTGGGSYHPGGWFDGACGDALLLRALVSLGYKDNERVRGWLNAFSESVLPDGGFLCLHLRPVFKYTPKSCMKDNINALLMLAECKKHGLVFECTDKLVDYFMKRKVFYRSNSPNTMVLNDRPGKRMIDNYFPAVPSRVGLPQLLYAFSVLGAGSEPELKEAWELLQGKKDREGKSLLEGTLAKSYLPKERVGKPSKWVTLYAMLAEKYREVCE
ncbi:MAG: hypothetical protein A2Y60_06525 [Chloroflexi bacterium RBG_13_54_9]|nr:MAG: hypothetical protein A2Y60_06525 [Chloroflexi bacterium RBG_13_54_9]